MAKKITKTLKLTIQAGKANPAPPIGPALGQAGINIGEFVKRFNDATAKMGSDLVPVTVSVYEDRTFSLALKAPPAASMILKAAGIEKGSGKNLASKVGSITKKQVEEIAAKKIKDLNANDLAGASKIIAGTARSMGVEVK